MSRLIDADALKAEFTGDFREVMHYTGIRAIIDHAPTVEPKKGKWERHPDFLHISSANIHRCSLCKERPLYTRGNEVLSAFCPSCGAKMR